METTQTLKIKILDLLKRYSDYGKDLYLTDLSYLIPEIKGEYSSYLPINKLNKNPNIIIMQGISREMIKTFQQMLSSNIIKITYHEMIFMNMMFDNAIILNLPLANEKSFRNKEICWNPFRIELNINNNPNGPIL